MPVFGRQSPPRFRYAWLLAVVAVLGPWLWCFGPALGGARSFLYRDAAHYYYPLFQWCSREWAAGRVPLWNPQENCGVPVLADTTSSVLYPGKLLFALPLPYATAYNWYVAGHVLLAAAAAFYVARRWAASLPAALLAAISYAFGGNVLFQYCNVVFLVGAAWLPLALLAADRMLVQRSVGWALGLGAVLALMTLGGDPHGAYHAGLLAALYAWLLWRHRRAAVATPRTGGSISFWTNVAVRLMRHRLSLLALAAGAAALLAAVQMLPAAQWLHGSDRAAFQLPRSFYEVPAFLARAPAGRAAQDVASGLFGRPREGTHHEHIYHFSVGPWRLAELLWPNCSGRQFPENRRWIDVIPAEGPAWTPTLYQGLLPLLLALGSWRLRGGAPRTRWLSWALLLATLGSFGCFGLGWLIQEVRYCWLGANHEQFLLGQPVGGLYWLMVVALPGYAYFRYPAKLLTIAALAISLLAAHGFDRLLPRKAKRGEIRTTPVEQFATRRKQSVEGSRWRVLIAIAVGLSSIGWLLTFVLAYRWEEWLQAAWDVSVLGPLDVDGALLELRRAFLHTGLLGVGLAGLFCARRSSVSWRGRIAPGMAVLLTAVELAVAQGWMVPLAPVESWQQPAYMAQQIAAHERDHGTDQPFRVYRASRSAWPAAAASTGVGGDPQQAGLRWDRDTLFPKHHLDSGLSLLEADDTLAALEYRTFLRVARQYAPPRSDSLAQPHPSVLDALAVRYLVIPRGCDAAPAKRVAIRVPNTFAGTADKGRGEPPAQTEVWCNTQHFPRAWIVHHVEAWPRLASADPAAINQRTRELLFPKSGAHDLRDMAFIESDRECIGDEVEQWSDAHPADGVAERCRIVVDQPQRLDLDVVLARPGLVVLSDLFYPGWSATAVRSGEQQSRALEVLRTNRIMRGLSLPAGSWRIVYTYRPVRFYLGAALSSLAWLGLLAAAFVTMWRRRNKNSPAA